MEIYSGHQAQISCEESFDQETPSKRLTDLKEVLQPVVEAALDLPMQSSPAVCLKIKGGTLAEPALTSRVKELSSVVLNQKPIDVYVADVAEPFISAGPFNERDLLICRGDESDFTLKRSLFALKSLEGPVQSMAYATSLLVSGIFLIHSGFILGIAVGLGGFWCAHAYSHDSAYLELFPEDKDQLLADIEKRSLSSEERPKTLSELIQNTAAHILFDIPTAIKLDAIRAHEAPKEEIGAPEPEEVIEAPEPEEVVDTPEEEPPIVEEKQEPAPEPLPETKQVPQEPPRRGRGGARG